MQNVEMAIAIAKRKAAPETAPTTIKVAVEMSGGRWSWSWVVASPLDGDSDLVVRIEPLVVAVSVAVSGAISVVISVVAVVVAVVVAGLL